MRGTCSDKPETLLMSALLMPYLEIVRGQVHVKPPSSRDQTLCSCQKSTY